MKKLILGMAITAGSLTFAQQAPAKSSSPVSFGVKAGMNVASLSKNEEMDSRTKIGFNAGLFANIPIASSFSVQPELLYSDMGAKDKQTFGNLTAEQKMNLSYITVPVMLQYNLIPNLYVEAGPEFGFMISAKAKGSTFVENNNGDTVVSESRTTDIKDDMKGFNVGIGLGAGYYFTPNIGVTARYVAGVTDIFKHNDGDAVRNNVFQVGLAYKF